MIHMHTAEQAELARVHLVLRQLGRPRYRYNCCVRGPEAAHHYQHIDVEALVQVYDNHWRRTLAIMADGNEAVVCTDGSILWLERL